MSCLLSLSNVSVPDTSVEPVLVKLALLFLQEKNIILFSQAEGLTGWKN